MTEPNVTRDQSGRFVDDDEALAKACTILATNQLRIARLLSKLGAPVDAVVVIETNAERVVTEAMQVNERKGNRQ